VNNVAFILSSGVHPDDAPPLIPPDISDEEFGAGGPWAATPPAFNRKRRARKSTRGK
jgi:hypothetical protein